MDFELSPELSELRKKVRGFVTERIIPKEQAIVDEDKERRHETLLNLQEQARAEGLWTPHLPESYGGRGLGAMGMCALFREMGRSLCGPRVFHCDAPDQGNMDLLLAAATEEQKERWLVPLCAGEITSAFCMTEPAPGAGTDPSNLRTRAVKDGHEWVIDGHKWYSTGGGDAAFLILMARTAPDLKAGATLFLVDRRAKGVEHVRDVPTMAGGFLAHREAELRFEGVRVGEDAVLGSIGEGFLLAQRRLIPARLTHCMRWLGLADRALSLCKQYITTRNSFGQVLARHQLIQKMIADNAAAIHAGNLMTLHCAWMLENGIYREARPYSSMAKNHVARLLCKVMDDAIQMHGSLGYSEDMPFSIWYRHARAARIADGPDEIHDIVVARDYLVHGLNLLI